MKFVDTFCYSNQSKRNSSFSLEAKEIGDLHCDVQEVWKVSTTAGSKRVKKGSSIHESSASSIHSAKESDITSKSGASAPVTNQPSVHADSAQVSFQISSGIWF